VKTNHHPLDLLLFEGKSSRVFESARASVWHQGTCVFEGGTVPAEARFDLASVTKVMCTTALLCRLAQSDASLLHKTLGHFFPQAAAGHVSLLDLTYHRSGLPAFVPFFEPVLIAGPELQSDERLPEARSLAAGNVRSQILQIAPQHAPGQRTEYSDVGFLLLGLVLEHVSGLPLDRLFIEELAHPLALHHTAFRRPSQPDEAHQVIDTQRARPREPAPGQPQWKVASAPTVRQLVDDDNAFVLDGVAGHAGLFGTADDVARFGQAILNGRISSPVGWAQDTTPGSTRTFGFDTPSAEQSSCGAHFGRGTTPAIGHLGFTGTSLWIDFDRQLVVALLSNRTFYGRHNLAIRHFRPQFHDAVVHGLGSL
jgi:serine-type D-Ala-D-Ala carboxypeptidase